jgi:hypothetical protein
MINDYYDGSDLITKDHGDSNYFKISPSAASGFFYHPRSWWGENMLDEAGFNGSSATILGNIVHYFAECAAKGQKPTDPSQLVSDYLDSQTIDFDRSEVETHWRDMANTLNQSCVFGQQFDSTEQFIYQKLLPGIYVGGTYDALLPLGNGTFSVRDYKTASSKPTGISYQYRMQAHIYAYILTKLSKPVSQIELQFIVKPTKTLPCRHFEFKEPFTSEDFDKIESQLMTIANSIQLWNDQPDLRWALAQDMRLRDTKPKLFI